MQFKPGYGSRSNYIPKDQRKKILLLSDDARMPSGVGSQSKEIILATCHKYNWVQVGAAINHPEQGKIVDISQAVVDATGVEDASVRIYPYNGYGDPDLIRNLMNIERPDAIMHFTDPRFWIWLYQMEHEVRQQLPLLFYHIWDDLPYPRYNENYYRSCDWIACISKQTYNIVQNVWKKDPPKPWQVKYIQHGINHEIFKPLTNSKEDLDAIDAEKKRLFGNDDVEFIVFYNNRNIRRKMTGDVILAYQKFVRSLPKDKADKCRLLMHTQPVDDNGTDLPRLIADIAPDIKAVFSDSRIDSHKLNVLYNLSDVTINLASNEGFGLTTCESIVAGTPIIVNVTGGLQDQCGFRDEKGELVSVDKHFNASWGSNHDGRYKTHGEWVKPVFPNNRALVGSPPTPYIFDDRVDFEDAAEAIMYWYKMSRDERKAAGLKGREFALGEGGFTAENMGTLFMEGIDTALANWKPRKPFRLLRVDEPEPINALASGLSYAKPLTTVS